MSTPDESRPDEDVAPSPAVSAPVISVPVTSAPVTQSREDTDVGWGEYGDRDDDERLLRDRPPHYGNG